jgi:hypothetical protein
MSNKRFVFDIESNGFMLETDKIWLAVMQDYDTGEVFRFNQNQMEEFRAKLLTARELIGHNIIMFDVPVVERLLNCTIKANLIDTLVISKMMYPDRFRKNPIASHSLSSWGEALGEPKTDFAGTLMRMAQERSPKEEHAGLLKWAKTSSFAGPPNDTVSEREYLSFMMEYCEQDVKVNARVLEKQWAWLKRNEKPYALEVLATKVCTQQVINGWGYDSEGGERLEAELMMAKADALDNLRRVFPTVVEERISEKTGKPLKPKVTEFNPGSHLQVYTRLNEKYNGGFKPPMTEKGSPQCDTIVLNKYKTTMPECEYIITYRDITKLEGQVKDWNERAHLSPDGRVHGGINVQGATTGRCTHAGPNMAQVSGDHRARSLWIPHSKDEVVLGADLSGLELRMLAHYMHGFDGGAYADLILNGDIHTANQKAAGLESRNQAKTFIYGFLYGAGDAKVGQIVGGSARQGKMLKAQFLQNLPALASLLTAVSDEAEQFNNVTLPDGRKVPVRSPHAALNTLLQGAGAIVSKYWMIVSDKNLNARFGYNTVKQMAYVHDEMQYSCPKDIAEEAGEIIIASALEAGERLGIKMPCEAEYQIGASWADTH